MRILSLVLVLLPLGMLASATARHAHLHQMRAELAPKLRELQSA